MPNALPEPETTVIPGNIDGTYSIHCTLCGDCGGNYKDKAFAMLLAAGHIRLSHVRR